MNTKKNGFTLVELVAVIGLLSIVSTLIFTIFMSGNDIYANGMKIENTETNCRLAMEALTKNVKTSKLLIGNKGLNTITTDTNFDGKAKYATGDIITSSDRIAYIETFNNKRYIYAFKTVDDKKELHEIELVDQGKYTYEISTPIIAETLTRADSEKLIPPNQDVEIIDASYITNYDFTYIQPPKLMYQNDGEDCYLVAHKAGEITDVKIKLKANLNDDFTVVNDRVIATYMDSITVENQGNLGVIYIKVIKDTMVKEIQTSVNILNKY